MMSRKRWKTIEARGRVRKEMEEIHFLGGVEEEMVVHESRDLFASPSSPSSSILSAEPAPPRLVISDGDMSNVNTAGEETRHKQDCILTAPTHGNKAPLRVLKKHRMKVLLLRMCIARAAHLPA
jgi:hypothetical protein